MTDVQPHLLRVARDAAGLTQDQVAEALGVLKVTVSRWENGARVPADEHLVQLSRVCGVTPAFFRASARDAALIAGDLHYRRRARVRVSDVRRLEATTNWLRVGVNRLLGEVDVQPLLEIPNLPVEDHQPESAARALRRLWGLPIGPLDGLVRLMEYAGIVVVLGDFPSDGLDGVSMWAGAWPVIYATRLSAPDRLRFTLAHELGHLILHREWYDEATGEAEADRFAAELLMPAEQVAPRLRNLTLKRAVDLKVEWRVSIAAVIQRARDTGAISRDEAVRLYKQRSAKGWTRREPFSELLPEETPELLEGARRTLQQAGYTESEIADLLYVPDLAAHPAFLPVGPRHLRVVV